MLAIRSEPRGIRRARLVYIHPEGERDGTIAQPLRYAQHAEDGERADSISSACEKLEAQGLGKVSRMPFSIKILLESVLRQVNGFDVREEDVRALCAWNAPQAKSREFPFKPARVIMQDFTGVPAIVDLAAMRDAMAALGGDPAEDQPRDPGGPRHRPFRAGGPVRLLPRAGGKRVPGVPAQPGALRVPPLGREVLRRLPRRAAGHGHRAPGEPRVPRHGHPGAAARRREGAVSRSPTPSWARTPTRP